MITERWKNVVRVIYFVAKPTHRSMVVRYLTIICILHNLAPRLKVGILQPTTKQTFKCRYKCMQVVAEVVISKVLYEVCLGGRSVEKEVDKGAIFWIFVLLYFCTLYFALLHFVFLYFRRSAPVAEVVIKKRRKLPHSRMHITPWAPYRVSYKVDWYKTSGNLGGITYT